MTNVSGAPAAGIRPAHRGRRLVVVLSAAASCSLVAAASLSATLFPAVAPAGADQVSSLQARASQLSSQMLLEQLQIGGYQQQYQAAVTRVQHDAVVVDRTRAAIQGDEQRIGHDTAMLGAAAVSAYERGGSAADVTPLFVNQQSESSRTEYGQVLAGNLTVAEDRLRTDRQALRAHEASLEQVQAQDEATQAQAQALLQQSQSTEQQLQQQSTEVNGELAMAVAQQQAQQAAAAAAAVAAAQAKAAAAAAVQQAQVEVSAAPVADPPTATVDPALNPFLQCVVQAESGGDYQAVSPNGQYMGAFQFSQSTWNEAAQLAGMPQLVGVPPNDATPAQQDALAVALYNADGSQPWYDPCTSS